MSAVHQISLTKEGKFWLIFIYIYIFETKRIEDVISKEGIKCSKRADIFDRIKVNGTNNCFITLKGHKENFVNHPTTRSINPAKNEIGRISKSILDKINICLSEKLKLNE